MANYISKYTGAQIDKAVGDVLNGNVGGTGGGGNITIDDTLTKAGAAADAKATGDRLTALSEEMGGLSEGLEAVKESIGATKMEWTDVSEVTSGAFINGLQTSPFYTIVNTPDYAYAVAVVDHSRKYRVTCSAPVGPRMIAMFRDENGVKVGDVKHPTTEGQIIYYENYEIEVPANAYDIVVTSYIGSNSSYVSCYPKIEAGKETKMGASVSYEEQSLTEAEQAQARTNIGAASQSDVVATEREIDQLVRRFLKVEKANDFAWGTFDKAYFVFVHDDTNSFLSTAYNAFHAENTPMSAATVASMITKNYDGKTAKEWLDLIVADGGEVLMHYNADLKNDSADDLWRTHVVEPKRVLEGEGFEVRGLILANNSDAYSAKGEKFCRRYYDYADKVGTSTRYKLGRTLMLSFASLSAFKAHIDTCSATPGLYAFGFHGLREDEAWITEASLREIIQYINAKSNTEITTYGAVFDAIGTTVLEKRIAALESAN